MKGIIIDNTLLFREYLRTSQILTNQDYEHLVHYETSTLLGVPMSPLAGIKTVVSLKESQTASQENIILNNRDLLIEKIFDFIVNNKSLIHNYYKTDAVIQEDPYEEIEVERGGLKFMERAVKKNPYMTAMVTLSQATGALFGPCEHLTRFLLANNIITLTSTLELREFV